MKERAHLSMFDSLAVAYIIVIVFFALIILLTPPFLGKFVLLISGRRGGFFAGFGASLMLWGMILYTWSVRQEEGSKKRLLIFALAIVVISIGMTCFIYGALQVLGVADIVGIIHWK